MKINITWTIAAIIAVSSFLSPIVVALINNRHNFRTRKLELEHDEHLRELDYRQRVMERQAQIYYSDKKSAYSAFMCAAGNFPLSRRREDAYNALLSSAYRATLFGDAGTNIEIYDFINKANAMFQTQPSSESLSSYICSLNELSDHLNQMLGSAKPTDDCE